MTKDEFSDNYMYWHGCLLLLEAIITHPEEEGINISTEKNQVQERERPGGYWHKEGNTSERSML
jgi:hypothetical protein